MNRNVLLFLCIVPNLFDTFASEDVSQFTGIIKTTIRAVGKPARVTALVCWDTGRKTTPFLRNILINSSIAIVLIPAFRHQYYRQFNSAAVAADNDFTLGLAPVDSSYLPKTSDEHQQLILLDASCNGIVNLLNNSQRELNDLTWILFKGQMLQPIEDQMTLNFENVPISLKSEIFYCYKDVESERIHIKQIYRTAIDARLTIEWVGLVSNTNEFVDLRPTTIASRRRQNLRGTHLTAAMVVTSNDTLNHLDDYRFVSPRLGRITFF